LAFEKNFQPKIFKLLWRSSFYQRIAPPTTFNIHRLFPAFTFRFSFPKVGKKIRLKCAIGGSSKIDLKTA